MELDRGEGIGAEDKKGILHIIIKYFPRSTESLTFVECVEWAV